MSRTNKLVDLLYWRPISSKGSIAAAKLPHKLYASRRNPGRRARPEGEKTIERESSEMEMEDSEDREMEEDVQNPSHNLATSKRRKKFHWPAGMDLKARRAYGEALMSGHGVLHFVITNCAN